MKIVSRSVIPEDLSASSRPGWEGMRIWWLVDDSTTGSKDAVVCQAEFASGVKHDLHVHPNADEIFCVIDGEGDHLTEDGAVGVRAGDIVFIPRGEPHGFQNTGAAPCRSYAFYGGVARYEDAGYDTIHLEGSSE